MSLPKSSKVKIKTPQRDHALPAGLGAATRPSGSGNIQGPLHKNPAPSAARRPDKSGNKIKTVIQTSTSAARRK